MARLFGDRLIKEDRMVVKLQEDGIIISDLHLAAMILSCIEGTACYKTIPKDESNTKFLFYINGDKEKIHQFVEYWFSGDKKNVTAILQARAEELRRYGNIISMLKALLDKAKFDKNNSNIQANDKVVKTEVATGKKDVIDKN